MNYKLSKWIGEAYKKAFLDSYDWENRILNNIWSIIDMEPFEPYVDFYNPSNKRRPRIKDFFSVLWKNYKINKKGKKDFFSQVEKI